MRILLFLVVLAFSTPSKAQQTYICSSMKTALYNSYGKEWVFGLEKDCNLTFYIKNNLINVDDAAQSSYKILDKGISKENDIGLFIYWTAKDEDGTKVTVILNNDKNEGRVSLSIMYSNVMFVYFIRKI